MPTEPAQPGGRPRRDRQRTSRAILRAATSCFAESGYDAATTRSIAERAGLSEGLIHRYFGGKQGLLIAIMRQFLEDNSRQPSLPPGPDLSQAIRSFLTASATHHQQMVDAMRVLISRAIIDPEVGHMMGKDLACRHIPGLAEPLARANPTDAEAAAFVLSAFSFVLGFMAPHVFGFEREQLNQVGDFVARAVGRELQSSPATSA